MAGAGSDRRLELMIHRLLENGIIAGFVNNNTASDHCILSIVADDGL